MRFSHQFISISFPCLYKLSPVQEVQEERRAKEQLLTMKLRTHTETEQARNGRQKIELILDVIKAGQGKRELWNKQQAVVLLPPTC